MPRPYMPMFWGDYIRDTRHLSLEEHGAYLMIIAHYWERGSLPDDDDRLARILGVSRLKWSKLKLAIKPFFNNDWTHDRIEYEIEYTGKKREKNRENGRAGGRKKQAKKIETDATLSNKNNKTGLANATPNAVANALANALPLTNPTQLDTTVSNISDLDKSKSLSETDVSDQKAKSKKRISYPDDFAAFWKAYPTDPLMAKKTAYAQWKGLDEDDRLKAISSIAAFVSFCQSNPKYRPVHACRYLSERRFDGFSQTVERVASIASVVVRQESPQGRAWEDYTRATKGKGVPWTNGVWRFPTEFPPVPKAAE